MSIDKDRDRSDRKHSTSNFQEDWLADERFKIWVRKVPDKPQKAFCTLCSRTFDLTSGGVNALNSHQLGKGHASKLKERKGNRIGSFFKGNSSTSAEMEVITAEETTATASNQVQSILPYNIGNDVLDAEILWCLNMVDTHQSYRSCDNVPQLFKRMFKNDTIAQNFKMMKDKSRYLIVYGIYPSFEETLMKLVLKAPWFSISFDESYNRQRQKCQMDVNIRYWNYDKNIAETSYLKSRFLLRPNAENLKDELFLTTEKLDKGKFLHLAMDGPTTNWKVLTEVDDQLCSVGFSKTINIGSCTLHILHGAFTTGMLHTEWKIGKVMKAMFKLLDESPKRRDIYLREGTSGKFPLHFCETRWIEDGPVGDRALEVWPSIVATIKHFQGLCKSSRPQSNKSYDTLVVNHLDLLVPSKLHFFCFLAKILSPYLIMYQTDAPMLPFMFDELSGIIYRLLRLVFRKKKLDEKTKLSDVMKEEFLTNEQNQIDEMQVDIGAAAKDALKKVNVSSEKKRQFRKECKGAVVCLLLKLLERLPTNKMVVSQAAALSPRNIHTDPDKAAKRFKGLAENLFSLKKVSSSISDNSKHQFHKFLETEVVSQKDKFAGFDFREQRLDEFLYPVIGKKIEYADLWRVCILLFTLNHGQAFTERGFSINKEVSNTNMMDDSLIAQRLIYDVIKKSGKVADFPITKELRNSCKKSRSRMHLDLDKKKVEEVRSDKELKRAAKREEIDNVKKRKVDTEKAVETLKTSLTKEAIASGTGGNKVKEHATKAAAFAKDMIEKEGTLKQLNEIEKKLEQEYKLMV